MLIFRWSGVEALWLLLGAKGTRATIPPLVHFLTSPRTGPGNYSWPSGPTGHQECLHVSWEP
jgi:hypothetical protein